MKWILYSLRRSCCRSARWHVTKYVRALQLNVSFTAYLQSGNWPPASLQLEEDTGTFAKYYVYEAMSVDEGPYYDYITLHQPRFRVPSRPINRDAMTFASGCGS